MTSPKRSLAALFLISLAILLAGCRAYPVSPVLGILSAAEADTLSASAARLGMEQKTGYDRADESAFAAIYQPESARTDEVQVAVRMMAEKEKIVALVGGTTNEATMRAAALVNFFNLPMLVPTAGGDSLLPSNNLWAFRLSAPGSAYAVYMIDDLLSVPTNRSAGESISFAPDMRIAILYEENTFGESTAVAAAHAAMRKDKKIVAYQSFSPDAADPARLREIVQQAKDGRAQVVSLIASSPTTASQLAAAFQQVYGREPHPLLIGLAGGFASQEFLASEQAEGVFVLRQKLVREGCPAEIESIYAAQVYAAMIILDDTVAQVQQDMPELKRLSLLGPPAVDPVYEFRERLRDELKLVNRDVPCVGRVAFDNTLQIKEPVFELVYMQDGVECSCSEEEFLARLNGSGR